MTTQKTLTVRGKRFTANQVDRLMTPDNMTNGLDYIVTLNGERYFANYRQRQDAYFAPVCDRNDANAIALSPDNGMFKWSIWLDFDPPQGVTAAASALGSMTSEAKAAAARENGRRGGRPRKEIATMSKAYQVRFADNRTQDLYEQVLVKVRNSEELQPYEDVITYDWDEGDTHYAWVLSTSDEDIIDWAKTVQQSDE